MTSFLGFPRLMWAGTVARDGPLKLVKEVKQGKHGLIHSRDTWGHSSASLNDYSSSLLC